MDSKQLKQLLGDKAEGIIISGLNLDYDYKKRQCLCPIHSEDTPSFKWNEKTNDGFKCFGCGESMDIFDYYQTYENMTFIEAMKKVAELVNVSLEENYNVKTKRKNDNEKYKKPNSKHVAVGEEIIKYFESRGIKKQTLEFWRVAQTTTNFNEGKKKAIVFPCYDETGELVHESYRSSNKEFRQSQDTKSILYGMWHVDPSKTLYITEGQIDCMSVWQAGEKNVVSIPAGANNHKFIDNCFDFLNQFKDIVLWADNDEAGRKFATELKQRFKHVEVKYHTKYKDANETLMSEGSKEILDFLYSEPELPKGIKKLEHLHYKSEPASDESRIETGFSEYDEHIDDWRTQQLTIVFGRDNEGKSTFISQVVVHQLIKKKKTFLYSAELGEQGLQDWLFRQLIGSTKGCYEMKRSKYKEEYFIKPNVIESILTWGKDTLYLVDRTNDDITEGQEELFESMRVLATKHGVKLFIIDNLQSVLEENASSLYSDQSNFVEKCRRFAYNYDCHVVLVAHPRKVEELSVKEKEPSTGNLTKDDISGSKNISNKAHNVISVERDFESKFFDMIVTNLKDKKHGIRKGFKYHFSKEFFRFYNDKTPASVQTDWKKFLKPEIKEVEYYNRTKQTFKNGEFDDLLF